MKDARRAFLITALLTLTGVATGQGVSQGDSLKTGISGFHGNQDTLVNAINAVEQGTGGKVTEIRFSETNGLPGYHAVVSKGGRIEFLRIQQESGNVVQIDAASGPVWMLKWRNRSDVHFADNATVSLSTAVRTAERSMNGAPALAAGIARSASNPSSDVQALQCDARYRRTRTPGGNRRFERRSNCRSYSFDRLLSRLMRSASKQSPRLRGYLLIFQRQ